MKEQYLTEEQMLSENKLQYFTFKLYLVFSMFRYYVKTFLKAFMNKAYYTL